MKQAIKQNNNQIYFKLSNNKKAKKKN